MHKLLVLNKGLSTKELNGYKVKSFKLNDDTVITSNDVDIMNVNGSSVFGSHYTVVAGFFKSQEQLVTFMVNFGDVIYKIY